MGRLEIIQLGSIGYVSELVPLSKKCQVDKIKVLRSQTRL